MTTDEVKHEIHLGDRQEWLAVNPDGTCVHRYIFRCGDDDLWWHYHYGRLQICTKARFIKWIRRRNAKLMK